MQSEQRMFGKWTESTAALADTLLSSATQWLIVRRGSLTTAVDFFAPACDPMKLFDRMHNWICDIDAAIDCSLKSEDFAHIVNRIFLSSLLCVTSAVQKKHCLIECRRGGVVSHTFSIHLPQRHHKSESEENRTKRHIAMQWNTFSHTHQLINYEWISCGNTFSDAIAATFWNYQLVPHILLARGAPKALQWVLVLVNECIAY